MTAFYGAPVATVIFVVTLLSAAICLQVYTLQKASLRWATRKSMELSRKVFWQSFLYVAAFYVTLPFVLLSYYIKFAGGTSFWIFGVAAVMAPAQGLINALIYFQRSSSDDLTTLVRARAVNLAKIIRRRMSSMDFRQPHNPEESKLLEDYMVEHLASLQSDGRKSSRRRSSKRRSSLEDPQLSEADIDRLCNLDSVCNRNSVNELLAASELSHPGDRFSGISSASISQAEFLADVVAADEATEQFEATMEYWRLNYVDRGDSEERAQSPPLRQRSFLGFRGSVEEPETPNNRTDGERVGRIARAASSRSLFRENL